MRDLFSRVVLVTEDERGVASCLTGWIRKRGGRTVVLRMDGRSGRAGSEVYTGRLTSPSGVRELMESIRREHGPIGGIVHLLSLYEEVNVEAMDLAGWREHLALGVKSLFYLAQAAAADLKEAAKSGSGFLVGATSMGGAFGTDRGSRRSPAPAHGGVAGLVKTLAVEWPDVRCKVIDLDPGEPAAALADHIDREIAASDDETEVGYRESRRVVLRPRLAPLDIGQPERLSIDSESVLLITGGARGITAQAAIELATRYRPVLLLVGRTPLPEDTEEPETATLTSPAELRSALIRRMRRMGEPVVPAQIEAVLRRLWAAREIRSNLTAMAEAGATVHYYSADVRDETTFASLIGEIYRSFGRIDGVVHGAGVIEDRRMEEKTPDSFDRVFDTKVDPAFILAQSLRPDQLRFLVFFSSVAGRFGNAGQSDYAAANEVLNKLAVYLDDRWPGRVVAMNWGPWAGSGMVAEAVARQFEARGVELVSASLGRRMFDEELRYGAKGDVEVTMGRGPWARVAMESPTRPAAETWERIGRQAASQVGQAYESHAGAGPFRPDGLGTASRMTVLHGRRNTPIVSWVRKPSDQTAEFTYELDAMRDLYLQDHQIDGKPVLPAAMAVELMVEIALQGWPEWEVLGLYHFRLLKGIILANGPKPIRVEARLVEARLAEPDIVEQETRRVEVEIREGDGDRPAYRGVAVLGPSLPNPIDFPPLLKEDLSKPPWNIDVAYRDFLFHGPRFRCMAEVLGIGPKGGVATVRPSAPSSSLAHPGSESWAVDPILLDAGPQLAILWARELRGMTALPSRLAALRRFRPLSRMEGLTCCFEVVDGSKEYAVVSNVYYIDDNSRIVLSVEGLESTCSRALNRLAG